jgi:hypothetical protein
MRKSYNFILLTFCFLLSIMTTINAQNSDNKVRIIMIGAHLMIAMKMVEERQRFCPDGLAREIRFGYQWRCWSPDIKREGTC